MKENLKKLGPKSEENQSQNYVHTHNLFTFKRDTFFPPKNTLKPSSKCNFIKETLIQYFFKTHQNSFKDILMPKLQATGFYTRVKYTYVFITNVL